MAHMALIDCHECGNPKSDQAKRCPHCGARKPYVRWKQNLLATVLIGAVLLVAFGSGWLP